MRLAFPQPVPRGVLVLMLVALGLIWSGTFSLARIGADAGIAPLGYGFWFLCGVGLGLSGLGLAQGSRPTRLPGLGRFVLIGGLGIGAIPSLAMFTSVRHIPTGLMAVIITLGPMLTYAAALAAGQERFVRLRALGMLAGLAGVALIVLPRSSLPDPALLGWVAFAFLTPAVNAVASVYVAQARPAGLDSWMTGGMFQLVSAAVVLPIALVTGQFHVPLTATTAGEIALACHILGGIASQFLMFELLRLAGPVFLSQTAYIVTLGGIVWGWLVFGERLGPFVWLAAGVVALGVLLVTRGGAAARRR